MRRLALRHPEWSLRRHGLQRLFSTFPGGWPGIGLLLLRAAVGLTALAHGLLCLTGRPFATPGTWTCDLLAIASGAALLSGFLTPVAGLVVGLGSTGTALGWTGASGLGLLGPGLATLFLAIMAIAIVCLGPGARSLDARLFGRREIVITPAPRARTRDT